jgi:Tol biopolymer transport system component
MKADGTGKVRLTHDKEENHQPVWSKEGEWIYFQRNDDIYRMRPDGSDFRMVVEDGFSFNISEDGSKIVYVTAEQDKASIKLRDLETAETKEIVPAKAPEFEGKGLAHPTLSPDGQWLAFTSEYPKPWIISMLKIDGSESYQIGGGCMPQYRPDGAMITWITSGHHHVYLGTPDGKNQRPFERSIPGRPHSYFPKWSNDGKYIVFAASPNPDQTTSDYEIYIKSVQGGKAVRLTFHPGSDIWPDLFIPVKRRKPVR